MDTTDTLEAPAAGMALSDSAARRIGELLAAENQPGLFLRISVSGGGCSGFQYGFTFDDAALDDDLVIAKDKAVVHVDSMSLGFLAGAELDYVEDMIGASFQVKNPNASSSCGCGSSFAV